MMPPETTSYCARCGTSLAPGAFFCLRCGTSVRVTPGGASATVAPPVRRVEHNAQVDALRQATLGQYEILAELGRGGMATVYLAHDLALDRKVAIKVLAPALLLMGEGMVERFKREARTAAALSHPHIIPIYAVKESEHVLYSLGVVAYEMLTGRLPFLGDSTMAVMYAHFNERPRPVAELRPDCPPNLGAGVMRMLEKDPLRRWPAMDDIVAVCGRPSLRHDDPVRGEMITLAKAGAGSALMAQLKTPTSPLVLSKSQTHPAVTPVPRAGPGSRLSWGMGGVGAVAIAAALWWLTPWRAWQPSPPPVPPAPRDTVPASQVPPAVTRDTARARRVPEPGAARASREPARVRVPAPPPAAVPESAVHTPGVQRDDSVLRSLRARALSAMSRAIEAGATPTELARGDTALKAAESLAAQSRVPEAMVQLATAASFWTDAERQSRARVARDTQPRRAAEPPAVPAVTPAPVDPRPDIQKVIDDYARALESRDAAQVRRAYPGLTSGQQQSWQDFFQSVRNLT